MNIDLAARLDLFFGDANPAETRIYARLAGEPAAGMQLTGTVTGPFCEYAQTLSATIPLVDMGPGRERMAQAIVPDPCFWSPDSPYWYRVNVELLRDRDVVTSTERMFGIRPLGARGERLWYAGQTWVLRGVRWSAAPHNDLADWHEAGAAMLVENPSDGLCEEASRLGVLLAAVVTSEANELLDVLRRLARWPAVGFFILQDEVPSRPRLADVARNVVFVQRFAADQSLQPATSIQAVLYDASSVERFAAQTAHCRLPVIAYRPAEEQTDVAAARRLCDVLQRDLADGREIAGYVV